MEKKQSIEKYVEWQKKQYSQKQKLLFLAKQEFFHLLVMPLMLFLIAWLLDKALNLYEILPHTTIILLGSILLLICGLSLSLWTRWIQFKIGQGTPAPQMPTQKLIIKGPYKYCRNPMILGDVMWLIGLGALLNSLSFILISIFWFVLHLLYYKFMEEKELIARFGQEYLEYKKRVGFLTPKFNRKN
jgi:protein-S-isoprenylcysteine O-methyltransferase Ste14